MKKLLSLSLVLTICLTQVFGLSKVEVNAQIIENNDISILYSNKNEVYSFENAIINIDGTNYGCAEELFEKLSFKDEFTFEENSNGISFKNENFDNVFTVGSNIYTQNGIKYEMPINSTIYNSKVYLPIRYVANSLGLLVNYDAGLKQIVVTDYATTFDVIYNESQLPQFSELTENDIMATLHTEYGDITFRLFPEYAPLAVENFTKQAESGYYDGVSFHRVINDFVIQGGDPTGTGTTSTSIYNGKYDDEISPFLRHFSGAVAVANSGPNTNGSQFYIVEANKDNIDLNMRENLNYFINNPLHIEDDFINQELMSPTVANKYLEVGGTPYLDFSYTIFGQVTDGMDLVNKIGSVATDQRDKPIKDVIIKSITIENYKK